LPKQGSLREWIVTAFQNICFLGQISDRPGQLKDAVIILALNRICCMADLPDWQWWLFVFPGLRDLF